MFRYQRLHCENIIFFSYINGLQRDLPQLGNCSQDHYTDLELSNNLNICIELSALKHIQYESPFESITPYIIKGSTIAVEYFYGTWRDSYQKFPASLYNRDDCRKHLMWVDEFIQGTLLTMWVEYIESTKKIAGYLNDDLIKLTYFDCSESDAWFLILLAKFLRDEPLHNNNHIIDIIRNKNRRRPKLFLDTLEAIENEPEQFGDRVTKYIKYFIKNEIDLEIAVHYGYISQIASLLWETARYKGIVLPDLAEEIMDRIMTRESIDLTN